MKRKKIATLLIAGVLALGIVGGSFAWFTSQANQVANSFATLGDGNEEGNGITIVEKFTPPTDVKPGDATEKIASVKNIADFDQFIRAKITIGDVTDKDNITKGFSAQQIADNIKLDFGSNLAADKWLDGGDGFYYFIGKVAPNASTSNLLEKVKLATTAGNEWQEVKYNVLIDAYGVQASNDAYIQEFASANQAVKDALAAKQ